ncbi:9362_t:CDS:2 [Gigaspora margarita]|uniref:9362_t:CDS:1 n=1 Tax=Gigaspora margarita TaxID=4874 RepID=A0ABN7VH17_GIGMA|nr:9362_t:CDS:2 [Gigaspora margarita]
MALIKDIDPNDIVEIWELFGLLMNYKHYTILLNDSRHLCTCMTLLNRVVRHWYQDSWQDKELVLQWGINISMTFQKEATDIIVSDLYIIEQIRDVNMVNVKDQQIANKKVRYANRFGRIKKALNTALDIGCEKKLINVVACFIEQKKSELENITNENNQFDQLEQLATKHLKSFSETQGYKEPTYSYNAIDPQDPI